MNNTDDRPDLASGISVHSIADGGIVRGRVDQDEVLLVRHGSALFAVAAHCTHYSGDLADGLVVGETLRCPLHHACFSLRTGEALRAPALDSIQCWKVERRDDVAYVREKLTAPAASPTRAGAVRRGEPDAVVIVGGGAAGLAAADMLRREGYAGKVTMVSADSAPPCDRPNLSKDYLAGTASDDWIPLRPASYYTEHGIDLLLDTRVSSLDVERRFVRSDDGREFSYGALLLATGAEALPLAVPGAAPGQIHTLRTYADSRAIIAKAASAKRAVVIGASFIGLEVAASLRTRGIAVDVVENARVPMERVLGPELGRLVQSLHETQGVKFHLGQSLARVDGSSATLRVTLGDGTILETDLIVAGVGVRPALALAEKAGLALDRGVAVDQYLQASAPGVFAAGDIARWPDPHSGARIRVEHWVVAERQGQVAALNILGRRQRFDAVPFFWSQHYDVAIKYVGHAEGWDVLDVDGSLERRDCTVRFKRGGRTLAAVTIGRDLPSLQIEQELELLG